MDTSDILATIALAVSIVSVIFSYRAHRQTIELAGREALLEFSRERSEFLVRIERSRRIFTRVINQIHDLLSEIETQPDVVASQLRREFKQLEADQRILEGCLRQSNALWDENLDMDQDGLAHHKPRHLDLIERDEEFAAQVAERINKTGLFLRQTLDLQQGSAG